MRKSLLFLLLLVMTPVHIFSQPIQSWIGLYANAGHEVYAYCPAAGFYPIEMWIWCRPGGNGQICAEFSVVYPSNLIQALVTWNTPLISVSLGELPTGLSVCYVACQDTWHWICHQQLWVTSPHKGYCEIGPHPGSGSYQIASCLPGYPVEPCSIISHLYFNDPCPPGP